MMTLLRLPDSELVFPGTGVPETTIEIEEVAFTRPVVSEISAFSQKMKQFISSDSGEQGLVQASGHRIKSLPDRIIINYTNYHQGSLGSFDWHNVLILQDDNDPLEFLDNEAADRLADGFSRSELVAPTGTRPDSLFN